MSEPRTRQLLKRAAATGAGYPIDALEGDHVFTATVVGDAAVIATVVVEGSNDLVGYSTIATLTLSGTGTASGSASTSKSYRYWRANVTAVSGGSVSVTSATEEGGAGMGGLADGEFYLKGSTSSSGGVVIPAVGDKFGAPMPLTSSVLDGLVRNVPPGLPPLPMQLVGAQGAYIIAAPNDAITAMQQYHASKYNEAVYYLKPSTGNDANDGLTPATPFATVAKAIRTATGAASRVVVLEDCTLPTFDLRSTDASQATEQIKILDGNGFDVLVKESGPDLSTQTWTQDATYPECWTATLALTLSAACDGVLFKGVADERGRWLPLKSYASIAELDADASGYFYNSGTKALTVKIFGNNIRSQRGQLVGLFKNTSGTSRILISGAKLGLANIKTIGVNLTMIDAGGRRPELWMHNSQVMWSTSKGLDMSQAGWFVASDVEFYSAGGDCANAFAPSVTGKGLIHDLRCRWSRGGDLRIFADNGTMQGISAHGGCDHVSWGSVYELNNGQGVADTCLSNYQDVSWLAACEFRRQARASPSMEFGSAGTNASRKVFLDSCRSAGPAAADLVIGANATVYAYNTPLPTVTGGTVTAYDPDKI